MFCVVVVSILYSKKITSVNILCDLLFSPQLQTYKIFIFIIFFFS